jgi:hypothetical protein
MAAADRPRRTSRVPAYLLSAIYPPLAASRP